MLTTRSTAGTSKASKAEYVGLVSPRLLATLRILHLKPEVRSLRLLYRYKSTNSDAEGRISCFSSPRLVYLTSAHKLRARFTCYTSTKVQILTQKALQGEEEGLLSQIEAGAASAYAPVTDANEAAVWSTIKTLLEVV